MTVERLPQHRVRLEVEVEAAAVERGLDKAYRRLVKEVKIPGFRQGKAPRGVVERYLGKEALWEEALDGLLDEAYQKALQETGLEPVSQPEVELHSRTEEGIRFSVEMEVRPPVTLPPYMEWKETLEIPPVTEESVQKVLDQLRQETATLAPLEEDRGLQAGDVAILDFEGWDEEGNPLPGGKEVNYQAEIGSGILLPAFEEGILAMKAGEEREITFDFPADHALSGKKARVQVKLQAIKEKRVPELDDFWAQRFGQPDMDKLREEVRKGLEEEQRQSLREEMRQKLETRLIEEAQVEIPPKALAEEVGEVRHELFHELEHAGLTWEAYLKEREMEEAQLQEEMEKAAANRLKTRWVLEELAQKENLEPGDADLYRWALQVAQGAGSPHPEKDAQSLLSSEDSRKSLERSWKRQRAREWLGETLLEEPPSTGSQEDI
ncbi:MAG: trigger factor [Bacillota bacterium]|nr:trigger factor [Bacillota bacterium]